jgi:hypothetical protein
MFSLFSFGMIKFQASLSLATTCPQTCIHTTNEEAASLPDTLKNAVAACPSLPSPVMHRSLVSYLCFAFFLFFSATSICDDSCITEWQTSSVMY